MNNFSTLEPWLVTLDPRPKGKLYLFHFISENEIIYIFMYFTETRQLGLEPESARKDKLQTRSPTNYLYVL